MTRQINAKQKESISLIDGKVETIFQTEAKKSGNGAIIYVPLKYVSNRFYVVVCK